MPEASSKQLMDEIEAHYPELAAELLQPLLHFMIVGRDLLGGDAEKILIMLVVSIRTKQHPDFVHYTTEQLTSGEVPVLPSLGVNIRSIADSTGIARETVRRKAAELVEAGFLVRVKSDLRYSSAGYAAIAPAREALERLAIRNYQVVKRLLSSVGGVNRQADEAAASPKRRA